MTSRDFCYWLQGFIEVGNASNEPTQFPPPNKCQWEIIRTHLNLVFQHEIDPSHGDNSHVEKLLKAHEDGMKAIRTNC